MSNYDYNVLSAKEFEDFSRDILQKHLNHFIESFTTGRDGGIDFRFSLNENNTIVIQCKRYKTYNSLKSRLKKEVKGISKLSCKRYILTTSVGLTDGNKQEIIEILNPFITKTDDVIGRDDLNNLLGLYPEIEKQHYKLWIASTAILTEILNKRIYNQSRFELEEIKESIRIYVQNQSYSQALDFLNKNRHVIISGLPGIGKTTLARMLILQLLGTKYDEFIRVNNSINEVYDVYEESKSQIFFYDDFLGRNFLDSNITSAEERNLIQFIDKVRKTKNKALIFTTREYILNQAKDKHELISNSIENLNLCIIDLSAYTKLIRAQILYNHLFFADTEKIIIESILDGKFYLKIIEHNNYNPRIIEYISNNLNTQNTTSKAIQKELLNYFDNPFKIWQHSFNNHISEISKILLGIIYTCGTPLNYNELYAAYSKFYIDNSARHSGIYNELKFKRSLRELENTFITILKDSSNNIYIDFNNPSIFDFLTHFLSENLNFLFDILNSSIYINQMYTSISQIGKIAHTKGGSNFIKSFTSKFLDKIVSLYSDVNVTSVIKITDRTNNRVYNWSKYRNSDIASLKDLYKTLDDENQKFNEFIQKGLNEILNNFKYIKSTELFDLYLLMEYFKDKLEFDKVIFFQNLIENVHFKSDMLDLDSIGALHPEEYEMIVAPQLKDIARNVAQTEHDFASFANYEDAYGVIEELGERYAIDVNNLLENINENIEQTTDGDEIIADLYDEAKRYDQLEENYEDEQIIDMYNTLLEKQNDSY